jgi:hypothetical protein
VVSATRNSIIGELINAPRDGGESMCPIEKLIAKLLTKKAILPDDLSLLIGTFSLTHPVAG